MERAHQLLWIRGILDRDKAILEVILHHKGYLRCSKLICVNISFRQTTGKKIKRSGYLVRSRKKGLAQVATTTRSTANHVFAQVWAISDEHGQLGIISFDTLASAKATGSSEIVNETELRQIGGCNALLCVVDRP